MRAIFASIAQRARPLYAAVLLSLCAARPAVATPIPPADLDRPYRDGHSRPRALLYNPADGLLYVALSTADRVAVIDVQARPARIVTSIDTGPFPQALAALPDGDVLVVCRYDPALGVIGRDPATRAPADRYRRLAAGSVHGLHGVAVHRSGRVVVASPALTALQLLDPDGALVQTVETDLGPRTVRIVPDPRAPAADLLLVANFIGHSVDAYPLSPDGRIGARAQRIVTQAPVHDFLIVPPAPPASATATLLLLTHEDRPVDRSQPFVAGLDSVVLRIPAAAPQAPAPFVDPGPGQRASQNLSDRSQPLVKLDAVAFDPATGTLAIVGAASDNVLLGPAAVAAPTPAPAHPRPTGNNPVAATFLPDGRLATADRLSDTVTLLAATRAAGKGRPTEQIVVGNPVRSSPIEHGEILFFSRALLPRNVGTGERSLYACSACHDDGHVDGRLHPARQNRFLSMTKTCRAIGTTAPYLFLGEVADIDGFAANLLSTHAQGAERGPGFDRYRTTLRLARPTLRDAAPRTVRQTLSPAAIRDAMAAYLARLPHEPSPFVPLGATDLTADARRGLALFQGACARCHALVRDSLHPDPIPAADLPAALLRGNVALTTAGLYDVGTPVLGQGGNNPPSLRGVWDNAPYFSDGSARTLDQVLARTTLDPAAPAAHARPSTPAPPTGLPDAADRAALLAFLRSL